MAKAQTPDFGKKGRLVVRTSEQGAHLSASTGEFIRCRLTADGPGEAIFSFACQHRPVRSAQDFSGHPKRVYEWSHFDKTGDTDAASDAYALVVAFAAGVSSYTFLMEKIDANGLVTAPLKDFDAASTEASDVFRSGIIFQVS